MSIKQLILLSSMLLAVQADASDSPQKLFAQSKFSKQALAGEISRQVESGQRNIMYDLYQSQNKQADKRAPKKQPAKKKISIAPSILKKTTKSVSYKVRGKQYTTMSSAQGFVQTGRASWYGDRFHGRYTASGQRFNMNKLTAAHKRLPFGTKLEVTNQNNGKKVVVVVNDRGPFHGQRIIDLSKAAARKIGLIKTGVADVTIRVL